LSLLAYLSETDCKLQCVFANHACKIVRHISFLAKTLKTKLELSHAQRLTERKNTHEHKTLPGK